jgi:hypothetical protein
MNEAFELLDPRNAQAYLQSFDPSNKRRGNRIYQFGQVEELQPDQPGLAYSARVNDGTLQTVHLQYEPVDGWSGDCTCPAEVDCEHVFAAMRALLAEHGAATVRNLSSGASTSSIGLTKQANKPEDDPTGLSRRLMATVGRPLNGEEKKYLRTLHQVFTRCRQLGHITRWDFEELGLRLGGYGWDGLQIWPALPADEHEFWLYVANAAMEHGLTIPELMRPITDLAPIEERLRRWRRSKEVEKWKQTLGNLRLHITGSSPVSRGETDLRLVLGDKEARLFWRRPGHEDFEALKQNQLQDMCHDDRRGRLQLGTEASVLWQMLSPRYYIGALHLRYYEEETCTALSRILRTSLLESRVTDVNGMPLARPVEPLRWELSPAENEEGNYGLRLVQADGSPPPPIHCVFQGNPALYLTDSSLFKGPVPQEHVLDPATETSIPAPAIERASGVAFLQALGLELPPRVRERIRTVPLEVAIHCKLQPVYQGSQTEDCCVTVTAEAADGHQQKWMGDGWLTMDQERRKRKHEEIITLYDRAKLDLVPELLEPMNLKRSGFTGELLCRVTRKFGETFSTWLKSIPTGIEVHLAGDLASFKTPDVAGRVKLDVTETSIDWFDLRVVLDVSDATLTPEEIKLLLNARGAYVRLVGKGWRRLQYDLSEEENDRLARLGLSPRELSAEPQRLHALQLADDAAKKFLPEQQVAQVQRRASELKARVAPDLPAGVTAQLRPYQLEGFHFLAYLSTNNFGGILADDMGLGKTLQTLAWLLWLRAQSKSGQGASESGDLQPLPSLVVCPKSVMDNWCAEAARFTAELRVKSWAANELSSFIDHLEDADLHVLNYNQLRLLGESLAPVQWQAVILDEGQYIKNPSSQTAQVARALRSEQRLVLSGTPIENRLLDLWSLMAFAMPGVLSSRAQFARLYDSKGDPLARRRLSARVRPFLLRRTKAQVARDLPDRIEEDLFCEMEGEQKMLYRAELKRAQQMLLRIKTQKEFAQERFSFLTSLLRLRQVCCHPRLVKMDSEAASAKTEALLEQLETILEEGHKVLVFSQFVELLTLLRPAIEEHKWPVFYLAGETENRGDLVQKFQNTEGPAIFLISLKAGGFGLNLTAASYVILFDPWWNPAVENQAIDRTHRIGQVNKVMAYRLLIKDSIEEKIRELQKNKKALAEDVLGEERFAQSLTLQDLQFLFAD